MGLSYKIRYAARSLRHQISYLKNRPHFREWREGKGEYSLEGYDRLESVFIHIPKTGGVSICRALYGNLGGGHKDVVFYKRALGPLTYRKYYSFAFVRNPYTRLLSAYLFLKKGGFDNKDKEFAARVLSGYDSFSHFVDAWINEGNIYTHNHFIPQYTFLCDIGDIPDVNFIGKFESLEDDFDRVTHALGVSARLPHHNKASGKKKNPADYYSQNNLQKIAQIYSKDFELFGYDKNCL